MATGGLFVNPPPQNTANLRLGLAPSSLDSHPWFVRGCKVNISSMCPRALAVALVWTFPSSFSSRMNMFMLKMSLFSGSKYFRLILTGLNLMTFKGPFLPKLFYNPKVFLSHCPGCSPITNKKPLQKQQSLEIEPFTVNLKTKQSKAKSKQHNKTIKENPNPGSLVYYLKERSFLKNIPSCSFLRNF